MKSLDVMFMGNYAFWIRIRNHLYTIEHMCYISVIRSVLLLDT